MNILLVDDSMTMRNILRNALVELPNVCFSDAADGLEALALIAQRPFDLVLIDWLMPKMDGLTLVKRIRETNRTLPLVMVTNQSNKMLVLQAIKAGVNGYLVKPFTPEILLNKVNSLVAPAAALASAAA